MGARTHEVQVVKIFGAVVRAEPGGLGQHRLEREGRTEVAVQLAFKMQRVDPMLGDDVFLQVGQVVLFQEAYNAVAVGAGSGRTSQTFSPPSRITSPSVQLVCA